MQWTVSLLAALIALSLADEVNHQYSAGETIVVWMNHVGPNFNPQETYSYNSMPFCRPKEKPPAVKLDSLGSLLEGNDLIDSGILNQFKQDRPKTPVCELVLTESSAKTFTNAVKNAFWYQMYIDELPAWGLVGEFSGGTQGADDASPSAYLYTHRRLDITYNGDQVIQVSLTSDNLQPIIAGRTYPFTVEVHWKPTTELFENRFDHYLDSEFFEHQIHWFSIFNSFMMVLFLCGLVVLIVMRTLRNDYGRYSLEDDGLDLDSVNDESGWKQIHSDVFRSPPHLLALSTLIGAGHQLFSMFFLICFLAMTGHVYRSAIYFQFRCLFRWRGALMTNALTAWVMTSFVGGYSSASFYKRNRGRQWKRVFLATWCIIPAAVSLVPTCLNFVSLTYLAVTAVPFSVVANVIALWLFLCGPLTLIGTLVGRSVTQMGDFPCHVSNMRRPIPLGPWYLIPSLIAPLAGILPFGSIFIEMHFVLTAFWNYKFYYVYGFLLLVFVMLTFVTMSVTVVITYFKLNSEDYRWHWMTYQAGASTGIYVFLYCSYYFVFKTQMTGAFQTAYYFAYSLLLATGIGCMCGAIAFTGANLFINRIYKNIKSD